MPSNFTEHYNLSQWERTDKIQMEDFNADNVKIDAALKAEADARADALKAEADARASADGAINSTLAAHAAGLAKRGNCQIYTTSYVGNGKYGVDNPTTLTFPRKPLLIFILDTREGYGTIMFQGCAKSSHLESDRYACHITWQDNTVSWFGTDYLQHLNQSDKTYVVMALFAMD